jgi:hypothetical protein
VFLQVVTKRTKNLKKQEIPSLDDPISKLNHIGKETVKKLNELKASADEAQLELKISKDLHKCVSQLTIDPTLQQSCTIFHSPLCPAHLLRVKAHHWEGHQEGPLLQTCVPGFQRSFLIPQQPAYGMAPYVFGETAGFEVGGYLRATAGCERRLSSLESL